ncbi:MAG: murein transglycosylase A [Sphingobium sp.]
MTARPVWGAVLGALLLSACAGGVIPPSAPGGAPAPQRPSGDGGPGRPGGTVGPDGDETAARPIAATPRPSLPVTAPADPARDPGTAAGTGVTRGPDVANLIPAGDPARRALRAFRLSCPSLMKRADASGLTRGSDWNAACAAASSWPESSAGEFFARNFEAVQVGDGAALVTGYYEPEIAGSRVRQPGYGVPIYRRPADLVDVNLGLFSDALKGKTVRGRVEGTRLVPFDERAQIVGGSLAGRGLELAWAADPIEFFFLQIQGSGRLLLPDGGVMRIGYDGQNGQDYTGIGKLMKDRGLIQAGSMQDIMQYLRAHPKEGAAIMNENKSFIFFRELIGDGPIGAMGIAVTAETTVAADPKYVPLGAPVLLSLDRAEPGGLWIAQDTGGAIKGANRFDSFWGAGSRARGIAGGMAARGSALLLLPIGSYARLTGP